MNQLNQLMEGLSIKAPSILIGGIELKCVLVNDSSLLLHMIQDLEKCETINVDFEGIDLCKTGTVCIGQFHVKGAKVVYILDFVQIKNPFDEHNGRLKTIMESNEYTKVFFDPRNDSDAIIHQYGVTMQNVLCLQLCEVASRRQNNLRVKFIIGLKKAMETHLKSSAKDEIVEIKKAGLILFEPEHGGTYEVFRTRPLSDDILRYCVVDVYFFDDLYSILYERLLPKRKEWVKLKSNERILECKQPDYLPKSPSKAFAPN
jgi:exonuclease 3'-5' domain-containing protein 1